MIQDINVSVAYTTTVSLDKCIAFVEALGCGPDSMIKLDCAMCGKHHFTGSFEYPELNRVNTRGYYCSQKWCVR